MAVTAGGSIEKPKDDKISKVTPTDATHAIDDLIAIGFKKNMTYKVISLTEETGTYYGFGSGWRFYEQCEFDTRFYSMQSDTVEFVTAFADERTVTKTIMKKES